MPKIFISVDMCGVDWRIAIKAATGRLDNMLEAIPALEEDERMMGTARHDGVVQELADPGQDQLA